ncbi:Msh2 [Symbiodinium sp. CCMP2592]|nr:Msh2 [Symbiodinium sp. CCMP2592]
MASHPYHLQRLETAANLMIMTTLVDDGTTLDLRELFGLAVFDDDLRAFRICEYSEDVHLSRTEALLLQLQPRSCCQLLHSPEAVKKLRSVADSCGVAVEDAKPQQSRQADLEQDLLRLLAGTEQCGLGKHLEEQRKKQGMRALAVLIAHQQLLNEPANFNSCTLGLYPLRSFMFLDKAAFSALNVLPRPEESQRSATNLLGFLNRCRSHIGQRRLRQWLTQPLTDAKRISQRHDIVEALHDAEPTLRELEGSLRLVPDLERLAARLHRTSAGSKGQQASLEDLVSLYQCVQASEKMVEVLQHHDGRHADSLRETVLGRLCSALSDFANFRALVEQTIDLKQAELRNYCISTAFDPSLKQLAKQRDTMREQMEEARADVEKKLGLGGNKAKDGRLSLTECPEGLALRATKKHQQAIQAFTGKPTLKVLSIKKQEVIFTTAELGKLNKQLQQAVDDYQKQTDALVSKALKVASTYCSVVERLADVLADLDVFAALARTALAAPCTFVRAEVDETGKDYVIDGAVHVLVVANSQQSYVANDLDMHRDTQGLQVSVYGRLGFDAVDPSSMHMTFLFFGEHAGRLPAPALETLHERLCRELLDEGLSTPMAFKGFEIFGKMNVVVATFDAPQSMLDLRDRVLQACLKDPSFPPAFIKLLKEQVEWIPHITLGKIRATRAQLSSVSCRRLRASLKAAQPKGLTMLGERPKRARLDWDAALEFLPPGVADCE